MAIRRPWQTDLVAFVFLQIQDDNRRLGLVAADAPCRCANVKMGSGQGSGV